VTFDLFATFDQTLMEPVIAFIGKAVSGVSSWISGPFKVAALLYIVMYGYMVLTGAVTEPVGQFVRNCIRIAAVAFLIDAGHYTSYVTDLFFTSLPNEIGSAINSKPMDASSFDSILNAAGDTITKILNLVGSLSPTTWVYPILAAMIAIMAIVVSGIGYSVSVIAKIGLALVLALGPVFVAMYLFQATRRFTEAFIGQIVNYVTLQVLVVALGSIIMTTLKHYTDVGTGDGWILNQVLTVTLQFSVVSLVSAILFFQLPGIAASLAAGGSQIAMNLPGRRALAPLK